MLIIVEAKTKQKTDEVIKVLDGETLSYIVKTKSQPIEGKANLAIIKLLSQYFNVSQSVITLIRGEKSKTKVFEILAKKLMPTTQSRTHRSQPDTHCIA